MNIMIVGSINKDIVLKVDHIVKAGETLTSFNQAEFIGGKGFNQAVAISKGYDKSIFVCNIHKNDTNIINHVQKQSFNADYIHLTESPTGTAFIQVDLKGENSIIICKNANGEIDLNHLKKIFSTLTKGDILVLQNEINDIEEIISIAKEKGLKIVLNPSPFTPNLVHVVKDVDILVLNQHELSEITQKETIEESTRYVKDNLNDKEVLITLGSKGSLYLYDNNEVKVEAIKAKAVDTTCAGDTYLGYFIASYAKGNDIKTCMTLASKAASLCVTREGASVSIPDFEEVK